MHQWNVAAAQYAVRAGGVAANVEHHLRFINIAAREQIDLLVFPELSLTGFSCDYQPQAPLAPDDPLLAPLADCAVIHNMTLLAGMPVALADEVVPGAVAFLPDGSRRLYPQVQRDVSKRGTATGKPPLLGEADRAVVLATRRDAQQAPWLEDLQSGTASLYASGQFVCESSWLNETCRLQAWAYHYKTAVLMANHAGGYGSYRCIGRSACWDERGQLVVRADKGELLVIARRASKGWQGDVIPLG